MDSARWNRLHDLFDAACARPAGERHAFLRDACGDDTALYEEVAALLDEDVHTHAMLDGIALDAVPLGAVAADAAELLGELSLEGTQVGPYHLVRLLGTGGMGDVYLAERAAPEEQAQFEQRVALKLVKPGMDSRRVLRRFQQERQILARLDHANIARLLDGGVTDAGQPYFVMELVDGVPIDVYCDQHRLTIDERLGLFQDACRAVLYAHSQLVVHRDLKPSNILVTEDADGQPTVKLLDFGIAKVLAYDDAATALTRTGGAVMTPAYASPEQMHGEPVGTATDIYSLGVVLYELLAGQRPHALPEQTLKMSAQALASQEPEAPSTVVRRATTDATTGTAITEARSTQPERLRRRLTGDLDVICLTALRTEPARRYATVAALLDDVRRHLTGLPVTARPDTAAYRVGKFVQRHRAGVGAAAVTLALVVALSAFYTGRLAQERNIAQQERDRAQTEAAKATQVTELLVGMFEAAEPGQARGDTVTVRAVLDRAAPEVRAALEDQPAVRATMLYTLGEVYRNLQLFEEARPLMREAVALQRSLGEAGRADLVESLNALARLDLLATDFDASIAGYEEALALNEAEGDALKRAELLNNLSLAHNRNGDLDQAEALLRESLALKRATPNADPEDLAATLYNAAWYPHWGGVYDEAEPLYREALALFRDAVGDDHPNTIHVMMGLADCLADQGKLDEAEALMQEGIALTERVMGPASLAAGGATNTLGQLYREKEDYDRAIALQHEALDILAQHYAADHLDYLFYVESLAITYHRAERYAEAEPLYRRILAQRRARFDGPHQDVSTALSNLGLVLKHQERYDEAHPLYAEALAMDRALYGDEHRETATTMNNLAALEAARGRHAQAEAMHRDVLALRRALFEGAHANTAVSLHNLGAALAAQGKVGEAAAAYREALAMYTELYGEDGDATRGVAASLAALPAEDG